MGAPDTEMRNVEMGYRIVVAGATGNVGREMVNILAEREFPADEIALVASSRSQGEQIEYGETGKMLKVQNIEHFDPTGWDMALFAIGSEATAVYAPKFAKAGCTVIDNSSLYRMDPDVPLIVPEVNPEAISGYMKRNIIANPNCSTAQMVVALKPLHDVARIKRVVVATYQSVSGAGKQGMDELFEQSRNIFVGDPAVAQKFTKQIAFNVIPHIDSFLDDGSTKEEWKMVVETKKILDPKIKVTATCARPRIRRPFRSDQHRIRGRNFGRTGAEHPARGARRHADRQARGRRIRHAGRMCRRLCDLHQPRARGFDRRERAEPVVRVRQPPQGRGAERGADRGTAGAAASEEGGLTVTGQCRCGACRLEIKADTLPPVYACHCHICQRASGSAFSVQALVREADLAVTGPIVVHEITTEDRTSIQRFCGTCHSRVYNTNTRRPQIAVVRAGLLDRSEELYCRAHIFTQYKQKWVTLPKDVPQWAEAAPPDEFIAALMN
jgi:aspartate-semialdehyde dehydrogenase